MADDRGEALTMEAVDADAPPVRYSHDLFHAFGAVCDKAKSGVQSCQAVAAFVAERANMEAAYARALHKTAANATADDWAPGFAKCWALVHETLTALGKIHTESAAKMHSTMVAGARAFAAQQEIQVQRLIAEGTKVRTAHTNIVMAMERAKEKYDKRCSEAQEILATMRSEAPSPSTTNNSTVLTAAMSPTSSTAASLEESKEIVGQLLTRMSSFAKPSMERQRTKLDASLEDLLVAEKHYTQSVEYMNSKQVAIEREIAENLLAFQLTEEQRIEYLKDLLERMQKLHQRNLEVSTALVSKMRNGTTDINEFEDIEAGFRKLSQDVDPNSQILDPADNAFYQRMCQVQAMSDRGHTVLQTFHATLIDLMNTEDHFVGSANRLLRAHDAPPSSGSDLFSLSTALSQVIDEGSTMVAGWQATKEQLQRLTQVRLEFRSLLAEPVALNIATIKQDYENARATTHENFSKSHMLLCQDTAVHQKLKQKFEVKCRDFAQLFGTLPEMGEIDLRNSDVTQVLDLVQHLSGTFSEKEKRTEAKLKALGEEVREAQQKLSDSLAVLKARSSQYIQDVDMFISVYMKNEKFRLQVEKSSLISLTKALEHMVEGAMGSVNTAMAVVDLIDPIKDMCEFVLAHRKPRVKKAKRITPEYVNDEALKGAIEEYRRNKFCPSPLSEDKKSSRNGEARTSPRKQNGTSPTLGTSQSASLDAGARPVANAQDDDRDGPLLGMSDFQKRFKLDAPEQVVESYSCALFANNFPNHGRMYLTAEHLCFSGWRDTIYVVSYFDITNLEKKNSALIVPNALEVTANGEKVFFTSFVFRDECLQRIQQLQAIKMATAAALADPVKLSIVADNSELITTTLVDVPSPTTEAPVAPSEPAKEQLVSSMAPSQSTTALPASARTNSEPNVDANATATSPSLGTNHQPERVVPANDRLLDDYELVIDEEVPFSVGFAYKTIWVESSAFIQKFLERGGETSIRISPWEKAPVSYTAVSKPDNFHGKRNVSYVHNKKYMVGPSSIPTMQTQRYKWDASTRLVITVTTVVSDAPYCDYFRAENRWVFSITPKEGVCKLQVGISVQWVKSTWLKKQIESTAMGEARETTRALVNAAIDESKLHTSTNQSATVEFPKEIPTTPSLNPSPTPTTHNDSATVAASLPIKLPPPQLSALSTERQGPSETLRSLLQVANLLCIVLFFYMMYRIGSALDQMQLLARETLEQQRQQQELFREILLKLHGRSSE